MNYNAVVRPAGEEFLKKGLSQNGAESAGTKRIKSWDAPLINFSFSFVVIGKLSG